MTHAHGENVLVVEDDIDSRDALALFLECEGFQVTIAGSAEEGLARLRHDRYDVVLSDYALPKETGTWMLRQAAREDRLAGTITLLLTGHSDPEGAEGLRVVRKPIDLDDLLREIVSKLPRTRVSAPNAPAGAEPELRAAARAEALAATSSHVARGAPRIEFVLYTTRVSPASRRAVRNLERTLRDFDPAEVVVHFCDVEDEPARAIADRVDFTPTLVKISPEPRTWLLGDLRDPQHLLDLLHAAGVDAK